jgi:hypothetical protein
MMIMQPSRWGLLLLGLVMASCESGASLGPVSPAEQQALIESAASTSPTLHPGEKIRVIVFGEDRLSGEYEIDPASQSVTLGHFKTAAWDDDSLASLIAA